MNPRAAAIMEVIRSALASMEHLDPSDQDLIIATLVAGHVGRGRRTDLLKVQGGRA